MHRKATVILWPGRHVAVEPAEAVAALGRRVVELAVGAGLTHTSTSAVLAGNGI